MPPNKSITNMPYRELTSDDIKELISSDVSLLDLLQQLFETTERIKKLGKKNIKQNNVSAGVELRHELRSLRGLAEQLLKETYKSDKKTIEERKQKRKNEFGKKIHS